MDRKVCSALGAGTVLACAASGMITLGAVAAFAAEKPAAKGASPAKGAPPAKATAARAKPKKIEKLACRLGTEDHHARIAVELWDGLVNEFAYYSIWKPRTCSLHVQRGDSYSKWEEFKKVVTVTLSEDKGAVLIDHEPGKYKFLFRDIDRMRYCGSEGKVSGSLTIWRGRAQCELEGVMDDDPSKSRAIEITETKEPPAAPAPAGGEAGKAQ